MDTMLIGMVPLQRSITRFSRSRSGSFYASTPSRSCTLHSTRETGTMRGGVPLQIPPLVLAVNFGHGWAPAG